jgi:predicted O-methyltransferase YrrM
MTLPALILAQKVIRHPGRALLRLLLKARLRRSNVKEDQLRLLQSIRDHWGLNAAPLLQEYRESRYTSWYLQQLRLLHATLGSGRMGTSENFAAEFLYVLIRAARPDVVVETGVLYGGSSGPILEALEANGKGALHSIDLGTGPNEPPSDFLVHPGLRHRWSFIRGDARRELPRLLRRLGEIDMFYHDSLHTFEHMTWEFRTAGRRLRPGGILASHDVRTPDSVRRVFRENAFPAFCRVRGIPYEVIRNSGFARWQSLEPSEGSHAPPFMSPASPAAWLSIL